MQHRGVVYDVGLRFSPDSLSVETYSSELVNYDMHAIATELHANAVRIEGEDVSRLTDAARAAHANGLKVFFNPWLMNASPEHTRTYIGSAAREAEKLRRYENSDLVLLVGCEYSIFSQGVFPGETFADRVQWFGAQLEGGKVKVSDPPDSVRQKSKNLNEILSGLVEVARSEFAGLVTYSAGTWEFVDWSIFDMVGVDFYRRGETAESYIGDLERHRVNGKPLVVMEVGCCTYEGAAARGDGGFTILQGVNEDGTGKFEGGVVPKRSEREQADYVEEQVRLLESAGVQAVFVFVFSFPTLRIGAGARDHDLASFALVKTFPDEDAKPKELPPWAPKEVFSRLGKVYGELA